jgi:adenylate kinase family enzyme
MIKQSLYQNFILIDRNSSNLKYIKVDGSKTVDEVFELISSQI